jgi:hypothetical protein
LKIENLLQLHTLTNLQELHLSVVDCYAIGLNRFPGLAFPATLSKLVLLSLVDAGVLSLVPTRLQHLELVCDVEGPAEGPGALLSCLARLTHLTVLILQPWNTLEWPHAGPAYAALTASSDLVQLELVDPDCLNEVVWPHVFPATHKLPHLTSLVVHEAVNLDELDGRLNWDDADLASLVSCCPSLRAVGSIALRDGWCAIELRKLTALTRLHVHCDLTGSCCGLGEFARGLATVKQLQDLELQAVQSKDCEPDLASLLPLTRLTALTRFVFDLKVDAVESDMSGDEYGKPFGGDDDDDFHLELTSTQVSQEAILQYRTVQYSTACTVAVQNSAVQYGVVPYTGQRAVDS